MAISSIPASPTIQYMHTDAVSGPAETLAIPIASSGVSRSANRIPAVLPHSAAEIARQSLPTKFRFPDHEMERSKRGLSAFDDIERLRSLADFAKLVGQGRGRHSLSAPADAGA